MTTETVPFDAATYLTSPEAQSELLADALATGDASYITTALGTIARARGMTDVARIAGITREGLYKALSAKGDPRLSTFLGVMRALGFELTNYERQEQLGEIRHAIQRACPSFEVDLIGEDGPDGFTVQMRRRKLVGA